jgi:hypothetical protein
VRTPPHLLQLKVELAGIKPLIWRRVVLPITVSTSEVDDIVIGIGELVAGLRNAVNGPPGKP